MASDMSRILLYRRYALAFAAGIVVATASQAHAQLGPVKHDGYFEYQYRLFRSEQSPTTTTNLLTWRGHASTYLWQPYILQLDGTLGLTRTVNESSGAGADGTLVTGGLVASVFPRSRFPFRAYIDNRDNRVDGDLFEQDRASRNFGFIQTFIPKGGGRIALDFRRSDNDEFFVDGVTTKRSFSNRQWQLTGSKYLGRNSFNFLGSLREVSRDLPRQSESRTLINLRHRFRTSPRFFIEDTTFFSDESIQLDHSNNHRRFLQFNGTSTWRPVSERPFFVLARVLLQGVDAGPEGLETGSKNMVLTASANYQLSPRVTIAGNAGMTNTDPDNQSDESTVFQRLRTTYRADRIDLGSLQYMWGTSMEAGNRRERNHEDDTVQDLAAVFNHSVTRNMLLSSYSQLQFSLSQQIAAVSDTADRREQSLVHTAFATWNRQNGKTSAYVRLSASDRRTFGDREDFFQLVTLQASSRMQLARTRSLNGGLTLQYSNSSMAMLDDERRENSAFTYGIDLSYIERDLFSVRRLNFTSELRLLSRNLRSMEAFDRGIDANPDRSDRVWRNELDYRVGRLEFRLLADLRDINNRWMSQVYLQVRRHYGGR